MQKKCSTCSSRGQAAERRTKIFDDDRLYLAGDPALLVLGRPGTLAHWRSEGRGPAFIRLGSRIAYRGRDLNEWVDDQVVRPGGRQPGD